MKITFLGTNSWYDSQTGATVCTLIETKKQYIVLDAGFGLHKLDEYVKKPKPILLFISHLHIDHICGLHVFPKFNFKQKLTILLPDRYVKLLKQFTNHPFTSPLKKQKFSSQIIGLKPGSYKKPIELISKKIDHVDYTLGYRFQIENKVITYCCDTGVCRNVELLAKNCDLLINESSFLPGEHSAWGHTNPIEASKLAKKFNCKKLVLTHFAPNRYPDIKTRQQAGRLACKIFPHTIIAQDNMVVEL
ncbi:MAG: ribonuclease Z [bacterium]